jgi:hypothetical protein
VGLAPFFSDVRVFNTSYDATISLEATYRCFTGACPAVDRGLQIVIGPRQTKAYNDMVGVAFSAPNSAGGIEFVVTAGGSAADLGVTSRLLLDRARADGRHVRSRRSYVGGAAGDVSRADRQRRVGLGFRTNAAPSTGRCPVSARFDVFNDAGQILGSQTRQIAAHSGVQINNIFGVIGHGSDAINDAVIVVTGTAELFSYAAVIDNETTDPFS